MTQKNALIAALSTVENAEVREVLEHMIAQMSKSHAPSEEAKKAANEKRKTATAIARAALVTKVAPVLREALSSAPNGMTAATLFTACMDKLPEGFSAPKVQAVLLREMAPEVEKVAVRGKALTYRLKEGE